MIDVDQQINAVRRQFGSRTLEAGEARVVTITQEFDAEVDDVWDAVTNPERLPRWFLPVSGDLEVGGRYQLEGNAGGTIESCDPPTSFAATWEFGGEVSWIDVRLEAVGTSRTRVRLEHVAHIDDERSREFGPGAVGIGWELGLVGLRLHLASGDAVDPDAFTEWNASDDGRRFVALSSEGWFAASVAAGTEEAVARAAADRTTAFYTAAPEDVSATE